MRKSFDVIRQARQTCQHYQISKGEMSYIDEATTTGCAELYRLLVTAGLGAHFLRLPLLQPAFLPGEGGALETGGVAGHHVLALLLLHRLAGHHVALNLQIKNRLSFGWNCDAV